MNTRDRVVVFLCALVGLILFAVCASRAQSGACPPWPHHPIYLGRYDAQGAKAPVPGKDPAIIDFIGEQAFYPGTDQPRFPEIVEYWDWNKQALISPYNCPLMPGGHINLYLRAWNPLVLTDTLEEIPAVDPFTGESTCFWDETQARAVIVIATQPTSPVCLAQGRMWMPVKYDSIVWWRVEKLNTGTVTCGPEAVQSYPRIEIPDDPILDGMSLYAWGYMVQWYEGRYVFLPSNGVKFTIRYDGWAR